MLPKHFLGKFFIDYKNLILLKKGEGSDFFP